MIKLQLLLRRSARNSDAKEAVRQICGSIGIHITAEGSASLSATIDDERFTSMFSQEADTSASISAAPLKVPDELDRFVESISIAPKHIYMGPKTM